MSDVANWTIIITNLTSMTAMIRMIRHDQRRSREYRTDLAMSRLQGRSDGFADGVRFASPDAAPDIDEGGRWR